jgi:hypothetical protein
MLVPAWASLVTMYYEKVIKHLLLNIMWTISVGGILFVKIAGLLNSFYYEPEVFFWNYGA